MNLHDMREELAHWSFLPGWRFELVANPPAVIDGVQLRNLAQVSLLIHVPDEQDETTVAYPAPAIDHMDHERAVAYFGHWLRRAVHDCLHRSADEWLKRDGGAVFNREATR